MTEKTALAQLRHSNAQSMLKLYTNYLSEIIFFVQEVLSSMQSTARLPWGWSVIITNSNISSRDKKKTATKTPTMQYEQNPKHRTW